MLPRVFFSLILHSSNTSSELKIRVLRLEGLHVAWACVYAVGYFVDLPKVLGKLKFLETLCLSFFSSLPILECFFRHFDSKSLKHLGLSFISSKIINLRRFS
jgi:hypothetical protein